MEGVLNFLLVWFLFIVISLILISKKSEKQILSELNKKLFGFNKEGMIFIFVFLISVLSGFFPSPFSKSSLDLCECLENADYYNTHEIECDELINSKLGFNWKTTNFSLKSNKLKDEKWNNLKSACGY